jgi:DNA-binding NtrC family response regulator
MPTILVVENEPDLLQVLEAALNRSFPEVAVIAAADAATADLRLGANTDLAVALVDHGLGTDETGLDYLARLRTRYPDLGGVLFSGQATPEVEEAARRLGAVVMWKPAKLQALIQAVRGRLLQSGS